MTRSKETTTNDQEDFNANISPHAFLRTTANMATWGPASSKTSPRQWPSWEPQGGITRPKSNPEVWVSERKWLSQVGGELREGKVPFRQHHWPD